MSDVHDGVTLEQEIEVLKKMRYQDDEHMKNRGWTHESLAKDLRAGKELAWKKERERQKAAEE